VEVRGTLRSRGGLFHGFFVAEPQPVVRGDQHRVDLEGRADGLDHQGAMPDVPGPESLGTMAEQIAELGDRMGIFAKIPRPIDLRYVGSPGGWPTGTRPRGRQLQPAGPGRRVVGRRGLLVPAPGRPVPPPCGQREPSWLISGVG